MREADVPAQHPEAQEDPRLPAPHADAGRPSRAEGPATPRSRAPRRLIWRIRDHATFEALARARRWRRGPITVRRASSGSPATPPRVAYAVGTRLGGATTRNRLRRRLRAALHECVAELEPGTAYLVAAGPDAVNAPFRELVGAVQAALGAARAGQP